MSFVDPLCPQHFALGLSLQFLVFDCDGDFTRNEYHQSLGAPYYDGSDIVLELRASSPLTKISKQRLHDIGRRLVAVSANDVDGTPLAIVLDVVNAVDPIKRIHRCPLELEEHKLMLCPLHKRVDDAIAAFEEAFASTNILELLADSTRPAPLCNHPPNGPAKPTDS